MATMEETQVRRATETRPGYEPAPQYEVEHEFEMRRETVAAGSTGEILAGGGGAVLAVLGLVGIIPVALLAISVIAVGVAFLLSGTASVARFRDLRSRAGGRISDEWMLSSSVATQLITGVAGIVLGILALQGVASAVLSPIAAILFGCTLMCDAWLTGQLNSLTISYSKGGAVPWTFSRGFIQSLYGLDLVAGIGSTVLGILALVGLAPYALSLVALLGVSGAMLFHGVGVSGRMFRFAHS